MLKLLKSILIIVTLNALGSIGQLAHARIDLFDNQRGEVAKPGDSKTKSNKAITINRKNNLLSLTLVGLSKIDNTILYFRDKNNKIIKLKLMNNESISLPGYSDLIIDKVDNRKVYIKDNNGRFCQTDESKGIFCQEDTNIIEMTLVRNKARPKPKVTLKKAPMVQNKNIPKKPKPAKKGQPVPKGYRLVKTPFGDQLVPLKP